MTTRRRSSPASVMQGIFFSLALLAVSIIGAYRAGGDLSAHAYRSLAKHMESAEVLKDRADSNEQEALDTAGWITVERTAISLPVMQVADGMPPDYYLSHDAWGRLSPLGCPFLDERCSLTGRHVLISGHRVVGTDEMFSPLAECFDQSQFNQIGDALWVPRSGAREQFAPLCALRVPARFGDIQRFSFADTHEFRVWIRSIARSADARADDWERLASSARRALTLVTCAEANGHSSTKTLVVFVQ